ncbi:hypothetical protein WJX81_002590 [Elliptochloris bilobata]|uniref:ERD4-related membrane protein n=1 Tax=Elliptochloris bilobata TaxID=381761 RepID=A0AAW1RS40_9CHLO
MAGVPAPSPALAPGPGADAAPPPAVDYLAYQNNVSDGQIVTALWVAAAAGVACLVLFGALRGLLYTYNTRERLPYGIMVRPPSLPKGGFSQLWSHLGPVFWTSDAEIVHTAGLDSLMLCWTCTLSIQIFLPLTVLGIGVLLPVNYSGERREITLNGQEVPHGQDAGFKFSQLTLSNLARGSALYWLHFVFVYCFTFWVMWLLIKYYQSYTVLRQRYLTGGEALLNEWNSRFLHARTPASTRRRDAPRSLRGSIRSAPVGLGGRGKGQAERKGQGGEGEEADSGERAGMLRNALGQLRSILDVNVQMESLTEELGGGSGVSQSRGSQLSPQGPLTAALGHMQRISSMGAARSRSHSLGSPRFSHNSLQVGAGDRSNRATSLGWASPAGGAGVASPATGASAASGCPPQGLQQAQQRPSSLDVASPASVFGGGGSGRGGDITDVPVLPEGQGGLERATSPAGLEAGSVATSPAGGAPNPTPVLGHKPRPAALDVERVVSCTSAESPVPELALPEPISKYENDPPECEPLSEPQRPLRWWMPGGAMPGGGRELLGKPPVYCRKTVNATAPDGTKVAVNAQQYAVLVMDVPDFVAQRAKLLQRAQRGQWLWRMWYAFTTWVQRTIMLRRNVVDPGSVQGLTWDEEDDMAAAAVEVDVDANLLAPQELVEKTFKNLFPDSFLAAHPVHRHKALDGLLGQWDTAYANLLRVEWQYERTGCTKRPLHRSGCCGCSGAWVDSIDHWAATVRALEARLEAARQGVLSSRPAPSFFAFFRCQKDAAIACAANIHPEDGHAFRVMEAPGPEEVNWETLWLPWQRRSLNEMLILPFVLVFLLFPIGVFSGVLTGVSAAVCSGGPGAPEFLRRLHTRWYCVEHSLWQSIVTGVLPTVLVTIWQTCVLPYAFYWAAQVERRCTSLSALDRRVGSFFFLWDIFNIFLGAMLGSSVVTKIGVVLQKPTAIPDVIGTALTSSSNFFINYVALQALAFVPLRFLFPQYTIICDLAYKLPTFRPETARAKVQSLQPLSVRYGYEIGTMMLIFTMAMAYGVSSPIILPLALIYFILQLIYWRYTVLYVAERCYESGGRIWDHVFSNIVWILFIFEFFTGCVLLANLAYVQASLMWITLTPIIFKFNRYCKLRFGEAVRNIPLEVAACAPEAYVDPIIYTPPALRQRCAGWYPGIGTAWENWGMPQYST